MEGKTQEGDNSGSVPIISPFLQGDNGTFLLSLSGSDAEAFSVSPERAAGSVSVQVVVKNSEMVDYEKKTEMIVEVRWVC